MSKWAKIWLICAFISTVIGGTLFPYLWEGAYYHLSAFAFVGYTRVIYLLSRGNWSIVAFIIWLTTINSLADELFFNPQKVDYNEYFALLLMVIITLRHRDKWKR